MKKVLIIGIKGMAGHMLFNTLPIFGEYEIYGLARNVKATDRIFNIDVSETALLVELLKNMSFDVVVNCIGILNKDAEDNPSKAIWFNSYFPHFLEEITKNTLTKVVHISTDCVFSGAKGNYSESDKKDGVGFYAQSKALGEIDNSKDVTIRTSIIGPELNRNGIGLFHWFMNQPETSILKGYSKAYWSGITTYELAKVVNAIISQEITGLIQVSFKDKIDKFSLLRLFNRIYKGNRMEISEYDGYKVDKSLRSIRNDFEYIVPSYEQMLLDQYNWLIENESLYEYKLG